MAEQPAISSNLQSQWQDHWHMRDQTWKVLQYSILFFLGVVGLEIKDNTNRTVLLAAYLAVLVTSVMGFVIVKHLRQRQKEKFNIFRIYEHELGFDELIKPVLSTSKKGWFGRIDTSFFILVMQMALMLVSGFMVCKMLISSQRL